MPDKNHDKHEADKHATEKAIHDPKTPPKTNAPGTVSPEDFMTEQEKDAARNAPGSGAKQPYPTGDPPPPSESVSYGQGIKGVTDKPSAKPGSASGPAGKAPELSDKPKKET